VLRRVAITGLGAICALGHDVSTIWAALQAGTSGIGPIRNIPTTRLSASVAAEIPGFDAAVHFEDRRVPLLDRTAQIAVVAGREAVRAAALLPDAAQAHRRGVILAAAIGQSSLDAAYLAFYGEGASRVHPLTVPRVMPNAPASHLSMEFGLRGPCYAVASACASANHAIGLAADTIRAGRADVMLTGGADASIVVGVFKCWEALRVLSADTCRPFSRDRSGLVLGEGAGVLVLEDWGHAQRRDAPILAELAGSGMSADGLDITAPDAAGAAFAMRAALDDAGLDASEVGYVNAHGTGTRLNDRTESAVLHQVFGRPPPVSSSKSMIGHCLSAGGALEAVATVMALRDGVLPPTAGFREADPECDVDCVPNIARPAPIQAALSNSFAFGGLNAVLAFRRAA
jgi:nodulation protein E